MIIPEWFRRLFGRSSPPEPPRSGGAGASGSWEPPTVERLPRGLRNRNPGNIRGGPVKWQGEIGQDRDGFVIFGTDDAGLRAMAKILITYRNRYGLDCIEEIIGRWAPPSENNTRAYVDAVARDMNVPPMMTINVMDVGVMAPLMAAIIRHECGRQPYPMPMIIAAAQRAISGD